VGVIRFKYDIHHLNVAVEQLVYELEYGNTFVLGENTEKVTTLKFGDLTWVDWQQDQNKLEIFVKDQFFSETDIFEKILTSFIYNLVDFGQIRLEKIDISQSIWKKLIELQNKSPQAQKHDELTHFGTVIKPYYHTSLDERIALINKVASHNITFVKEDETYLLVPSALLDHTIRIKSAIGSEVHYVPNITTAVCEYGLVERLLNHQVNPMMVNILVAGFRNIQNLKEQFPELQLWGHRVGYNLLESHVSVRAFSQLCLLAGISFLHIGTPCSQAEAIKKNLMCHELNRDYPGFTPVFTKTSPEIVSLIQLHDIHHQKIIMACGNLRDETGRIDERKVAAWAEVSLHVVVEKRSL
jgi:hypothetical protein